MREIGNPLMGGERNNEPSDGGRVNKTRNALMWGEMTEIRQPLIVSTGQHYTTINERIFAQIFGGTYHLK